MFILLAVKGCTQVAKVLDNFVARNYSSFKVVIDQSQSRTKAAKMFNYLQITNI